MKKLLIILTTLLTTYCSSQTISNYRISDSLIKDNNLTAKVMAGSCASPNGGMNSIGAPPPSYAWLQTNGYCNPASYGKNGTICWSFTPTSNSININSGYSSSGCGVISFGPFTLYTCAPACAVVGAGLNFSVISGQCYTWCMGYSGTGGLCSFNDFCPYYQQFAILPIELSYFAGSNQNNVNILQWKTETERNNDYFVLEISSDALNWDVLTRIKGSRTTSKSITYGYKHTNFNYGINYYRLKQVDYNGIYQYHGIVVINNIKDPNVKIVKILNILGQEVPENYNGIKIIYYSDNSVVKQN